MSITQLTSQTHIRMKRLNEVKLFRKLYFKVSEVFKVMISIFTAPQKNIKISDVFLIPFKTFATSQLKFRLQNSKLQTSEIWSIVLFKMYPVQKELPIWSFRFQSQRKTGLYLPFGYQSGLIIFYISGWKRLFSREKTV